MQVGVMVTSYNHRDWDRLLLGDYSQPPAKPDVEIHRETVKLGDMVEPLGFAICALRQKSEAVDAITALGASDRFRLVHDTFHHTLAGGGGHFADHTGIIHISGVVDPDISVDEMGDPQRVLVDQRDRLGNIDQIRALRAAGFKGAISMESFAPEVHASQNPKADLTRSFDYIAAQLAEVTA